MCGLAGFLGFPVAAADVPSLLGRMAGTLAHRGPDDHGIWVSEQAGVGLAHRRLSIQDLSPLGAQPMRSASGRFVLAYNGEVYNFPELRAELVALGHAFRGGSDTEVMLAAFEQWGLQGAVPRFVGMFAFAVWDQGERCLWLCRDRLGVKPLYVGHIGNQLVFGSELKALRVVPGFDRTVDRDALALYMRHDYVPGPYSIYGAVRKLRPGVLTRYSPRSDGRPRETEIVYWSVEQMTTAPVAVPAGDADVVEQLDRILRDSVRCRMIADVPLGVLLSGGVDSSLVTGIAQAISPEPVKTFTIGFGEQQFNEAVHAREVARHLGTRHTELYITPRDALDAVPALSTIYDEPFGDSSQIPTLLVSRLARQQVTVALSGDGGDEFFYGYGRYPTAEAIWRRLSRIPRPLRRLGGGFLEAVPPAWLDAAFPGLSDRFSNYGSQGTPSQRLRRLARLAGEPDWFRFYRAIVSRWTEYDGLVPGGSFSRHLLADPPAWMRRLPPSQYMMVADIQSYLSEDILAKTDRASMSASLELREPLIDHRLAEFALALPLRHKYRDGRGKWALRQVAYRYVPAALLDRPKQGFEIPVGAWLRGPLREWADGLLAPDRLASDGYLDPDLVAARWADHTAERLNWQGKLWNVLMFQAWLDNERAEREALSREAAARPAVSTVLTGEGGRRKLEYLAVVEYCFADQPGGSGRVAWDMLKAMQERGHNVTLLCYLLDNRNPEGVTELDGIRVVRFRKDERPAWHPERLHAIINSTRSACRRWLLDRTFDCVHVHSPLLGLGVVEGLGREPRYVYTVHSPVVLEQEITWRAQGWQGHLKLLLGRGLLANVERRMLGAADRIQTLSEFTRTKLHEAYGVGDQVQVIPHWYPAPAERPDKATARQRLGWPADARIFFTVRSMGPRYGLDVAIRALAPLVQSHDCYFFLAGSGKMRGELEALAASLGAGDRIRFMGRISDADLELAYAAADLFILPTLALECFGLITIEALAFGCPVLSTDAAAIPESMLPILPQMLVPPGDVAALREKARQFLTGELQVPDRMTLIHYAETRYGAATVVPRLTALFEDDA
ncbi:MAG: asparagine synthase (glutamine-hydrolyzing) [Gammaproteobacteria bacterium]